MSPSGLTEDAWLGERLGKPAWHLAADAAPSRIDVPTPAFIDARVPVADLARPQALRAAGFTLVDTSLSFLRTGRVETAQFNADVGMGDPDDADHVARIAGENFRTDRFHADPEIDDRIADRIKADWARNFFAGQRGEWMVVGRQNGQVSGFLQLLDRDGDVVIDLVAVNSAARNTGLARAMITFAAGTCNPGAPIRVGTQLANTASIRLYESLGFRFDSASHIFHRHAR
ncbi:MAG: GNAT family N-acetyltransferase [Alphaproteobacteria bacterium]